MVPTTIKNNGSHDSTGNLSTGDNSEKKRRRKKRQPKNIKVKRDGGNWWLNWVGHATVFALLVVAGGVLLTHLCESVLKLEEECTVRLPKRRFFFQKKKENSEKQQECQERSEVAVTICQLLQEYTGSFTVKQIKQAKTTTAPIPEQKEKKRPKFVQRAVSWVRGLRRRTKKSKEVQIVGEQRRSAPAPKWVQDAVTITDLHLSASQKKLVGRLAHDTREIYATTSNDAFGERVKKVAWGGQADTPWWSSPIGNKDVDGAQLLASYLKIMQWPEDLRGKFPFKLCSDGCASYVALLHTLEYREKYKPWMLTPASMKENEAGVIYLRGHGPASGEGDTFGGHSIVWFRLALHTHDDFSAYIRMLIHTLDSAVSDSLLRSNNQVGKYNIVLDCANLTMSSIPKMSDLKKLFGMMQDHLPNRLGVLMLANLGGAGQFLLKMIKPLISEAVRNKIHAIPNDGPERSDMLTAFLHDDAHVPKWLGGSDPYEFNHKEYYAPYIQQKHVWTNEEGLEYLTTMPYHA
mmetsp:Transcript_17757/g.32124  ORF Transcript_17757/g.32124 Transcript_17757/m.32124 type:complete len:519 (-) Transcript_17757:98-1654(-)|eukprot:CAMPEP_0198298116 /NCGR_PEP_ID=MMETSP1449-20131203/39697_1 /TAXON_ID=420275 /ORGANISM="Attheya septentrionalis, Strain CCMP2084" /LENGTH=518 /DNA_ID=CAMNT_0043999299 /DNA_START=176 /DNA_END=1732 /DNA_ORIENTATION=-